jgi:predicted Zn-ribbon and HTH transcriptional regulator
VCYGNKKITHKEYVDLVSEINQNIEVVGRYVGYDKSILHRCKIDGYEWYTAPNGILHGTGCPKCAKKIRTHDDYVTDVNIINKNIEIIDIYKKWNVPILHRCKKCGCEWMARPNDILNGAGCPTCKESHGERSINEWLDANNISYQRQKVFDGCRYKRALPFDFYLPVYNICIEYQGIQHYKPVDYFGGQKSFESQMLRDKIKREYCKKNNIFLFEIPYYSNLDNELIKLCEIIKEKNVKKGVVA